MIKRIDNRPVKSMDDVVAVVDAKKPGDTVTLGLLRNGQSKIVTVTLAKRPAQAPQQ